MNKKTDKDLENENALEALIELEQSGKINRREFLNLSSMISGGLLLSELFRSESAFAWVATRMRKGRGSTNYIDVGDIGHSLRFRSSATAYLSRTPAGAGNRKVWTWSCWFKSVKYNTTIFSAGDGTNQSYTTVGFGDVISIGHAVSGTTYVNMVSSQVFRDPSAWYHLVISFNNGAIQAFINGQALTWSTNTNTLGGGDTWINGANIHTIGKITYASNVIDGYLSRIAIIDGQALGPTSFGYLNTNSNSWVTKSQSQVKAVVDAGGVNSFMLDFDDGSSVANLGMDKSVKANNWTCNNISITAGASFDWMIDTPSNNFCTLNPLQTGSYSTLSTGNLRTTGNTATNSGVSVGTMSMNSGKWYWEIRNPVYGSETIGVATKMVDDHTKLINAESTFPPVYGIGVRATGSTYGIAGELQSVSAFSWDTSNIIGVAVDADNGAVYFSKNGVWLNGGVPTSAGLKTGAFGVYTPNSARFISPFCGSFNSGTIDVNFGQQPFAYTPPTGFKTLCSANLPVPTITNSKKYFDINLYSGDSAASRIITNSGMMPNLVWTKARNAVDGNNLVDSIRGVNKNLKTDANTTETTGSTVTSFNTSGFTADLNINVTGRNYVAWQWKKGATPGFDIVSYTGTGVITNISHSLNAVPKMMIIKNRNGSNGNWIVYHSHIGNVGGVVMNLTNGQQSQLGWWNNTSPTSTNFTLGGNPSANYGDTNFSGVDYISYLFSEVEGFSKIGNYVGNGSSDGPFIYCGFRPKFVMVKWISGSISSVSNAYWVIWDSSRNPRNLNPTNSLFANSSTTEDSSYYEFDLLSNGFKIRLANGDRSNYSGGNYIFIAFAEAPFKYANAR